LEAQFDALIEPYRGRIVFHTPHPSDYPSPVMALGQIGELNDDLTQTDIIEIAVCNSLDEPIEKFLQTQGIAYTKQAPAEYAEALAQRIRKYAADWQSVSSIHKALTRITNPKTLSPLAEERKRFVLKWFQEPT